MRSHRLLALALVACAPSTYEGEAEEVDAGGKLDDPGQVETPRSCAADAEQGSFTVHASAPVGLGPQHLGRPLDSQFEPLIGPDAVTLFPQALTNRTVLNQMEHSYVSIEDTRGFAANAKAWVVEAGVTREATRRYAAYRAYQLAHVDEIDDATEIRRAPEGSVWYLWRIYYGHSFEIVASGEDRTFHAAAKADFKVASGGIAMWAESKRLQTTSFGRGMVPIDGDAIFSRTAEEIGRNYEATGEPVPIFVEYRSIPRGCVPKAEAIPWIEPTRVTVRYNRLEVTDDGSWGRDTWSLWASCTLNGEPLYLSNDRVWERREGVCDNPCRYDLFWTTEIAAVTGDVITCGMQGIAWDDGDAVEYSQFEYEVAAQNLPTSGRFGASNGKTGYHLDYSLEFVDPPPTP